MVFITRRVMTALDELRRLRADANPSVFRMTANTINRWVKAAGLGKEFSGRVGLARPAHRTPQPCGGAGGPAAPWWRSTPAGSRRATPPGGWNREAEAKRPRRS